MVKNYYYLITGVLAILFSVTHALNGQDAVLPALDVDTIATGTKTTFFYVWHIITAENLLFGGAFLVMSFHKDLSKVRFAAWVIAVLMVVRWMVIFGSTLLYDASAIKDILVDTVAIAIYVVLIVLGTRVKDQQPDEKPLK